MVPSRIDPVADGVAPVRAAVLGGTGVPGTITGHIGAVTIGGWLVPAPVDAALIVGFGLAMLSVAVDACRRRDQHPMMSAWF